MVMIMGDEVKDVIMAQIRRDVLNNTLSKGVRFDGRKFDEYRPIEVQRGPIKTAEGSAVAKIGQTMVLVAAKFDIVKPFPDRPTQGVMVSNAELLPTASPTFESGPPDEYSIEVARVVDRALRSAECVDLNSFFVETDKVLGLYLDIYVLNHAGNYTDTATLAATAALLDTKIPKVENGAIIRGEYAKPLNPTKLPLTTTMVKVGNNWLVDPSRDEERVLETTLTIGTTEEHVCAMQKGKGAITKDELVEAMEIAFKRGDDIRKILKG
ncbi:Exosome complex component Rrp42 [Candidatus Bilamarchaeum dharawalense]|uniref:Exosome complex component Rrp42 n=1 Tax=Candidatus Bilamarchaeum dharawalense TaxID=2885759 RepID=A0A5E4LUT4_9ARCH|nr:Exosome complex component Rrp42 [Candidatus Bilamarchaeum dharawalense]